MSINFLTTATKEYEHFVLPYIYSILHHVPNSTIEMLVEDVSTFSKTKMDFKNRVLIRTIPKRNVINNTIRFLVEPSFKSDFTYIGDCDIFIFDTNVEHIHRSQMQKNNCCYSNIVRRGTNRLTGLHCVKSDQWYHATKTVRNSIDCAGSDEVILYEIASIFGKPESCTKLNARPVHGLHLSPQRTIDSNPAWNVNEYGKRMVELAATEEWEEVSKHFDKKYLELIDAVIEWDKNK